jgi:hypothetical protein
MSLMNIALFLIREQGMKKCGEDVQLHVFVTSALDGNACSASRPGRFTPEKQTFPPPEL